MVRSFNDKVKGCAFMVGDLVLRWADLAIDKAGPGKLQKNWKGPYLVFKIISPDAYKLTELDGKTVPRA